LKFKDQKLELLAWGCWPEFGKQFNLAIAMAKRLNESLDWLAG
jgi:hypothetical protein